MQVASTKVQTQSGGGHSHGEVSISAATPPPQTRPPREVTSTRGIFCSRPLGPGLRALSEAGSSSSHHRLPGPAQRRQRHPPPRAHPRRPRVPRGGGDPRRPQRAAPPPGAHLKRGESLMHSSNSTVMAAAARGAHWHEDRGARSGIPGRPARPSAGPPAPRSAPARPGLRPPRRRPAPPVTAGECRQSPPPARAAGCHGRGASPMFAARARLPLSRPGSVAKRLPAARPRLARARTPRRPAL